MKSVLNLLLILTIALACYACSNVLKKKEVVETVETPTVTVEVPEPEEPIEPPPPPAFDDPSAAEVVATVGDATLTRGELNAEVEQQIAAAKASYGELPEDPVEVAQIKQTFEGVVISDFITETIFENVAKQHNIAVTEEDVATAKKDFEEATGISFEEGLKEYPYGDVEKARESFMRGVLMEKVMMQLVLSQETIDEAAVAAEVAKASEENKAITANLNTYLQEVKEGKATFDDLVAQHSMMKDKTTLPMDQLEGAFPPHVIQVINALPDGGLSEVISDEKNGVAAIIKVLKRTTPEPPKESAEAKLAALRERILAGEDFATLAAEHSACPSGQRDGGSLGSFSKGMMVPEFEKVAFELAVGDVSPIFKTSFGYHIVKVTARDDAAGTVTASHILIADETASPTIEFQMLIQPLKSMLPVEVELEKQRALQEEKLFLQFMEEQIKAQKVTVPSHPEVLNFLTTP